MAEAQPEGRYHLWILAAVVLLGGALRFTGLGDQSFWADERFTTVVLAGDGFWDVPHQVSRTESAPPLYYLLAWPWAAVFGDGEAGLRSLSALLGTATIPVVYLGVRELASGRAGMIAAGLCACSPFLVWYSQEARAYALYVLLAAGTFWFFARALNRESRLDLALWGVTSAVAVASFYLAAILVLCEGAVLLWRRRDRWLVAAATALPAATALAFLPTALDHRANQAWIPDFPFGDRLGQTFEFFLVGNGDPGPLAVAAVAIVVTAAVLLLALRGEAEDRRAAAIAAIVGLAGLAIAIAGKALDADYLVARNVLYAWLPLAAVASIALASRRLGALGPIAAALVCAVGIWLAVEVKRDEHLQRADYRAVAERIDSRPPRGTRVIVAPGFFESKVLLQYLSAPSGPLVLAPPAEELVLVGYDAPGRDDPCWWGGECDIGGTVVPALVPGFREVERSSVGPFTIVSWRAPGPLQPAASIGPDSRLYSQAPPLFP